MRSRKDASTRGVAAATPSRTLQQRRALPAPPTRLRAKSRRARPNSMCNFAVLFRILLALSVILPFADAIAQTSPAPVQASTSSASSASPDKKWQYVAGADEPKLLNADTKEVVLDLGEQDPGSVLWAPDSKRFALNYGRGRHQSLLYQLRDDHWVELESPDDVAFKRADAVLAAEAKREGVPKKASPRTPSWSVEADQWLDASTLIVHASLSKRFEWGEDGAKDISGDFLLTLKFDDAGKCKIAKSERLSEEEVRRREKAE